MKKKTFKAQLIEVDEVVLVRRGYRMNGRMCDLFRARLYPGDYWQISKSICPSDIVEVYFCDKPSDIMMTINGDSYLEMAEKHNKRLFISNHKPKINIRLGKAEPFSVLDDAEKKYLSALVRPFRQRITRIVKRHNKTTGNAFLAIYLGRKKGFLEDKICLPFFKADSMYVGMEDNFEYTLKELGL